jgi:hypothetical protein
VTIYDLLRRLTGLAAMPEPERADALKLLDDLENLNALGTVAKQTEAQAHECRFEFNGAVYKCVVCGKENRDGRYRPVRPMGHYY